MNMYYLDCCGGVSGDMLLSTFIDANLDDVSGIIEVLEKAGSIMSPTKIQLKEIDVLGTRAKILKIDFEQEHHHIHGLQLKENLVKALDLLELSKGREFAIACIDTILEAESVVHEEPIETIHLHETGSPDTLVDICGMAYFYEMMNLDENPVLATPISVGDGRVRIAHGIVDVPAPATALILQGMQTRRGPVMDELATPTGAAVLKNLIKDFVDCVPSGAVPLGRGTGTKRFDPEGFVNVLGLYRGDQDR